MNMLIKYVVNPKIVFLYGVDMGPVRLTRSRS
jgi:hypothetical protein